MLDFYSRLSTRYGNEISNPTAAGRRYAIADLFNETTEGLSEAHYAENPTAWYAAENLTANL